MTHLSWVTPQAWLGFIELDKGLVLVWLDWLVFCEYGFSVSALWCPLATPTILLGFLLPWAWGISSQLLQQSAAAAPYLGQGVSPDHYPSWPSAWGISSRPSCAHAATTPWTCGCSLLYRRVSKYSPIKNANMSKIRFHMHLALMSKSKAKEWTEENKMLRIKWRILISIKGVLNWLACTMCEIPGPK